jgi:hypothetical protein
MAKKKTSAKARGKNRGQKRTPSKRKAGAGLRASARSGGRATGRKTAGAKTPQGKARRKKATNPPRPGKRKAAKGGAGSRKRSAARKTSASRRTTRPAIRRRVTGSGATAAGSRKTSKAPKRNPRRREGGTGREETLAQTPETGRTVKGRTNPMPTRRSTGTPSGAGTSRHAPGLDRDRKQLRELEESIQGPPSSLDMDRTASAARSGRRHLQDTLEEHHETSPAMTGGDVDADWEDAYAVGDEAPGGDNPTPDQDRVDDIGKALGVEYQDNEELKGADKIAERDKHRWELDPASSDDYRERD